MFHADAAVEPSWVHFLTPLLHRAVVLGDLRALLGCVESAWSAPSCTQFPPKMGFRAPTLPQEPPRSFHMSKMTPQRTSEGPPNDPQRTPKSLQICQCFLNVTLQIYRNICFNDRSDFSRSILCSKASAGPAKR